MPFDDSDMKIAGDDFEPVKKADEQESVEATARQLAQEKSNGNLSRARRLGAIMADEVSAIDGSTNPAHETEKIVRCPCNGVSSWPLRWRLDWMPSCQTSWWPRLLRTSSTTPC